MAYRSKRGMGATAVYGGGIVCSGVAKYIDPWCWFSSPSDVAPPPAPMGSVLTVPPASGEEAQATVDQLLNQQMVDQQALNAGQVTSSFWDTFAGGASQLVESAPGGLSIWAWGALGLGAIALVFVGGGSPRRYGR